MIEFSLQLRIDERSRHDSDAWFLPGYDVRVWVNWLCEAFGDRAGDVALVPVARANNRTEIEGLFVPAAVPDWSHRGKRAVPYRLLEKRLFVPANSRLRYPLTELEFAAVFLSDINLLHPSCGLIAADQDEVLHLADLLQPMEQQTERWNRAHLGVPPLPTSLKFAAFECTIVAAEMLDAGREDIAREKTDGAAPVPGEKGLGPIRRGASMAKDAFFGSICWLTSKVPHTGTDYNWINRLEDWANSKWSQLSLKQQQQVDRLLHWLENDPDRGLRHAIPLGDSGTYRGEAQPDAALGTNSVDFSLSRLMGGGPVQPWMLDWRQAEALGALYRKAANRELTLKRFRRAAFIFAHLLNDYQSAADALKRGGFYREAAVLYRERLTSDRSAANCLREGGLYEEAAKIYEELGDYEALGDMYREIDREAEAMVAYERAVEHASQRQDTMRAAKLVDDKLHQPKRAREMLRKTWPLGMNSAVCIEEYYRLLQRDEYHDEALSSVGELAELAETPGQQLRLARVFSELRNTYAHEGIAEESVDAARVLIGTHMSNRGSEMNSAVEVLRSLDHRDRLLGRDARTYSQRRLKVKASPAEPAVFPAEAPVELKWFASDDAPRGARIQAAVLYGQQLILIGVVGRQLHCWPESGVPMVLGGFSEVDQVFDAQFVKNKSNSGTNDLVITTSSNNFFEMMNLGEASIGVCREPFTSYAPEQTGHYFAFNREDGILRRYDGPKIDWMQDVAVHFDLVENPDEQFCPMRATSRSLFLAAGNELIRICGEEEERVEIPAPALGMVESPPHTTPRLMFDMGFGAGLLRDDPARWNRIRYFASDMERPKVAFTRTGHLIAANREKIRVYVVGRYEIAKIAQAQGPDEEVCCVLPGEQAAGIRVVTEKRVIHYQINHL
ncbi:MAG: hypothetical protein CMO80_11945 [Verrucomicrobiales bacterium]|nr:hypothetical protein [Verrucomicrobiales bacterium]